MTTNNDMKGKRAPPEFLVKQLGGPFPTRKDVAILGTAAMTVAILLSYAAVLGGHYQELMAHAQQPPANVTEPGQVTAILNDITGTYIAISTLITTAMGIVVGVSSWLHTRFKSSKIVSDVNEWLQWLFEQIRETDVDIKNVFKEMKEHAAEYDTVYDAVKAINPEIAKKIEESQPELKRRLEQINTTVEGWQKELDRIYEVSPKNDPVSSSVKE